jgi:pimeloyl-ACP methyl ester carboxylesterase
VSLVRVGELDIAYRLQGEGPALLMVAGTGYPGGTWYPELLERLAEKHTVITYDHRGTGGTRGPVGDFSTRTLAADALGLLAALDVRSAAVLGHSMGGRVAQWMALDEPERVGSLVLAASGPGSRPGTAGQTQGVPVAAATGMVELGYEAYVRQVQRQTFFTEEFAARRPDVVEWLARAFWADRPSVRDYFQHVAARQQHNTVDRLAEITQPALCLVGDRDTHRRGTGSHLEQSEYLAAQLPDAELVVLPGVKHGYFWEAPEESARVVVEWLARERSPRPTA